MESIFLWWSDCYHAYNGEILSDTNDYLAYDMQSFTYQMRQVDFSCRPLVN